MSKTDRTVKSEIEATSALVGESGGNGLEPLQPRKGPVPALAELELSSPSNCLSGAVPITAVARFPEIFAVGDRRQYRVRIRKAVVMIECEGVKIGGDSISEILIDPDQFSLAVSEKNESNHGLGGEFTISGKSSSDIVQITGRGEARKKSDHKVESTVSARPPIRIVVQTLSNQWTIGVHKFGDPRNIHDGGSLHGSYLCVQGLIGKPLFHVFEDEQEEDMASRDNKDLPKPKLIGRILANLKSDAQIERTEGLRKFTGDYNHALALLKERLTELRILEDMDAAGRLTIAKTVCGLPNRPDDD